MTYKRFEDTPAWQLAIEIFVDVCTLTAARDFPKRGDLSNQLERAALSISNNIAEGFERGTSAELLTFLYIARGSAGEVRSALQAVERLHVAGQARLTQDTLTRLAALNGQCESVSRQLRAWVDSVQNSEIRGQRYLTEQTREAYQRQQRATAFVKQLKGVQEDAVRRMQEERDT